MSITNILVIGVNGFIGSNLVAHALAHKPWRINALDVQSDKLAAHVANPRFNFRQGDIRHEMQWIEEQILQSDVVLPLAAIANPATYVQSPLSVFELDFEANLAIVRLCVQHKKRLIFPSTSEVYGMQTGECNEYTSNFITGPTHKERWIYSSSKQLLDRVIYAYGVHHQLSYTLFRPFNWFGPGLDNVWQNAATNRVVPTFLHNLLHKRDIALIGGGSQKRCFLYIDDAIDALIRIIENPARSDNQIFNIGHPGNEASISALAETMLGIMSEQKGYENIREHVRITTPSGDDYYGTGYQDIDIRIPDISHAKEKLSWQPTTPLDEGLRKTIRYYLESSRP